MSRKTVTFRLTEQKRKAIDLIAEGLDRDRSYILNDAIDTYLETHYWQLGHIKEGIRQADAGKFVSEAKVKAAFARWHR